MTRSLLISLLLLCPATAHADARIARAHQVENWGANCCWASAATMLFHLGYTAEANAILSRYAHGPGGATTDDVSRQFEAFGLAFACQQQNSLEFLQEQTGAGLPVMVGISSWPSGSPHAVVVVRVDGTHVYFVDSGTPGEDWFRYTREDFKSVWRGWAVVVQKRP